ncbi:MAG: ribosomal protein S18-alanine N-acetyltransferase [candidate division NC10 bacterium]|nr:ribosomal protein S18-alanine N-acetyltransferase [candidate division NC10 bacterium]
MTAASGAAGEPAIGPIRPEEIAAVAAIEALSFSLPWTEEMFAQELARPEVSTVLVARVEDRGGEALIVGYICVWVVEDELHINNLAVDPRWRRRRVAHSLLAAALEHGRRRGAERAVLEVRASNVPALRLYGRCGFEPVGLRRRYYSHPVEDAVIMALEGI